MTDIYIRLDADGCEYGTWGIAGGTQWHLSHKPVLSTFLEETKSAKLTGGLRVRRLMSAFGQKQTSPWRGRACHGRSKGRRFGPCVAQTRQADPAPPLTRRQ
jgi:hypothetical protein